VMGERVRSDRDAVPRELDQVLAGHAVALGGRRFASARLRTAASAPSSPAGT
jgi:hypothetical protein